jgi:hypothetical protein
LPLLATPSEATIISEIRQRLFCGGSGKISTADASHVIALEILFNDDEVITTLLS